MQDLPNRKLLDLTILLAAKITVEIIAAIIMRVSISAEALGAFAIHANHRGAARSVKLRRFRD
jgi:hypothetical protein